MKKLITLALAGCAALPALAQVGVSVGINEPGVYGQVTIGDYGPPALVYDRPVIVTPDARYAAPVYMYVPAEQQRDWAHNCWRYQACGHPVYFVREQWVRDRWEHDHPRWRDDDRRYHHDRDWRDRDHDRDWHDNGRHEGWRNHGDHYEPGRDWR